MPNERSRRRETEEKKVKKGREEKGKRMKERYGKIKGNAGREIRLRN